MNRKRWINLLLMAMGFVVGLSFNRAAMADEFDSDGVKIHYTVQGLGEPVILIHGLYSSAAMNWDLPGISKNLAAHFEVIEFDNRGHGQSGKPEEEDQYGVKMAQDVVHLTDHLHVAKAQVVGYSMGGMIVMKLLTLHPERVSAAVLGGMGWLREDSPLQEYWDLVTPKIRSVPTACVRGIAQLAVTEKEVKAVTVPVNIIVGDRDPCRRLYVLPLRRIRPDWPEHVISGAGHFNCVTKAEFREELRRCLEEGARGRK